MGVKKDFVNPRLTTFDFIQRAVVSFGTILSRKGT